MGADFHQQRLWAEAAKVLEDTNSARLYWRRPVDSGLGTARMRMAVDPDCLAIDDNRRVHPLMIERLDAGGVGILLVSPRILSRAKQPGLTTTSALIAETPQALLEACQTAGRGPRLILSTPGLVGRLGQGEDYLQLGGVSRLDVVVPTFVPAELARWAATLPDLEELVLHPAEGTWEINHAARLLARLQELLHCGISRTPCEHPDPQSFPTFDLPFRAGGEPVADLAAAEDDGRRLLKQFKEDRSRAGGHAPLLDIILKMAEAGLPVQGPRLGLALRTLAAPAPSGLTLA